jgi:site-specific DNA recombinase
MRIEGQYATKIGEFGYYNCNNFRSTGNCRKNTYRIDRLEKDVLDYVFLVLKDLVSYEKVRQLQTKDDVDDLAQEIKQIEKTLAHIPARKSRIFELFENEDITREDFLERREELAEIEADARRGREVKIQKLQKMQSTKIDRAVFDETIKNFEEKFKKADNAKQKDYLAAIVESISIKDRTFKVNFRYSSHPA